MLLIAIAWVAEVASFDDRNRMASQRLYASTALSWEKAAHVKETDIAGR